MVAIKDMEMPKGCLDCYFYEGENTYCDGDILIPYGFFGDGRENKRHSDCPLIEIEERKVGKLEKIEQIVNDTEKEHYEMQGTKVVMSSLAYGKIVEVLNG